MLSRKTFAALPVASALAVGIAASPADVRVGGFGMRGGGVHMGTGGGGMRYGGGYGYRGGIGGFGARLALGALGAGLPYGSP